MENLIESGAKQKAMGAIATQLPLPQPKQQQFLETDAQIAVYGGAAGAGKTLGLLLDFAHPERLNSPHYKSVIFRRTYPEIRNEGGLWDESSIWFPCVGGQPVEGRLLWRFPAGSSIRFAHLQHEKHAYSWQGGQVVRIGFDELTHFTRKQFIYLLSRSRSTSGIPTRVRATCNPDAESWLAEFIDWWILPSGFPDPKKSGVIRWFVIVNDEVLWYDTRKEAIVDHPKLIPKSFTFIPAKITDNPALLDKDPEYIGNLQAQDEVERARLLDGNWKVKKSEAILFNRRLIDLFATGQWKKPKRSRRYVVGIDPNFGAMGGDFFVVQVWDFSEFPRSLVFEYRDNSSTMSASIVRAIEIVRHYDPIAVGVEVNAGGRIVAERIVAQCPWVEVKEIVTTETSKRVHCDRIALALESGHVVYPEDWVGTSEMRQYSKHNLEAISGHDDTISAWFVAFAAASGQSESGSLLLGT